MLVPKHTDPPPWKPDLDAAGWVAAVRSVLKLTQGEFADRIDAEGGRDTVAKWEGGVEPRFSYTRRIVTIAPPPLVFRFLGRSAVIDGMSDPDRKVLPDTKPGASTVDTDESRTLAAELNAIADPAMRRKALRKALVAIAEVVENPSELGADNEARPRPGKPSSGQGKTRT